MIVGIISISIIWIMPVLNVRNDMFCIENNWNRNQQTQRAIHTVHKKRYPLTRGEARRQG